MESMKVEEREEEEEGRVNFLREKRGKRKR